MALTAEVLAQWTCGFRYGAALLGVATLLFGLFSALAPQRSIALYQWMMARFNWRVSPINALREIRTTKLLGALLVLLSLAILWRLLRETGHIP